MICYMTKPWQHEFNTPDLGCGTSMILAELYIQYWLIIVAIITLPIMILIVTVNYILYLSEIPALIKNSKMKLNILLALLAIPVIQVYAHLPTLHHVINQ